MGRSRELYFKIERLDNNDQIVEEKTPVLHDGKVAVSATSIHRRKCQFVLTEELPDDWVQGRWRLYYGMMVDGEIEYTSLGIFLPLDPVEKETPEGKITTYQGVDKTELLLKSYDEAPIQYSENDTLKEVAQAHYDAIGETRQNLDDLPYALNTNYTFGDWRSAHHTLKTFVDSFTAQTYYDKDGIAVLKELPAVEQRPVSYEFLEGDDSIHTEVSRKVKNSSYWNRVIVTGGKADEIVYRKELTDSDEVTRVGRTITERFRFDAANSQTQVDALATQLLYEGTRVPTELQIKTLPLTDLEVNQIIQVGNVKYEVLSFDIPLNLKLQTIKAGRIN